MEEGIKKHGPLYKDLAKTWMKWDTEAIGLVLKWLVEKNSFGFDHSQQDSQALQMMRREMQIGFDRKSVISMYHAGKVQDTGPLITKKDPKVNQKELRINSLNLFN